MFAVSASVPSRPSQPVPFPIRALFVACGAVAVSEWLYRLGRTGVLFRKHYLLARLIWPFLLRYQEVRSPIALHPVLAALAAVSTAALIIAVTRAAILFYNNEIKAWVTGSRLRPTTTRFPMRRFDLLTEIARRPRGTLFVGYEPRRTRLGWRWKPAYLSQEQKTMHRHVLGKTGSGKTASILFPAILQDAIDGKGLFIGSQKGPDEDLRRTKAIAVATRREAQLRVFRLPAWNQPQIFTHTYNMVYVRPRGTRTPDDPGGDPVATAERVFAVLTPDLGDNQYYNTQARIMFDNLCRLLHGMVNQRAQGIPFTLSDLAVCFKGLGQKDNGWGRALEECRRHSVDRRAAAEIASQLSRLGWDVQKCFSGIIGAIDKFQSPVVNAYDPDIVFEDVLEQNLIVYAQLPANLFPIQAKAMGRVMLMDIQQVGSMRQIDRLRNQNPVAVYMDEFYNFADLSIIDSLNKLRDAHLEYTLAHQSLADLELVSKEFAVAVWDNTRTKDVLNQDNPELCDKIAKSIGTEQALELTVRRQEGALMTSIVTGDASSRLVEAYRLHPNAIKNLARQGQGYLYNDEGIRPVVYAMLPPDFTADFELKRKDQTRARGLRLYERFVGDDA